MLENSMETQQKSAKPSLEGKKTIFRFYDLDGLLIAKNTINGRSYRFNKENWEDYSFPIEVERDLATQLEAPIVSARYRDAIDRMAQTIGSEEAIEESKLKKQLFLLLYPDYLEREFLNLLKSYTEAEQTEINIALKFAKNKHAKQYRIHHAPYYTHPVHAAICAMEDGAAKDEVITLLLHDTLEDTSTTSRELEQIFGSGIAAKVGILSKKKDGIKISPDEYERKIAADNNAIRCKGYDRLSNIISLHFTPEWHKHDKYIQETTIKILPMVQTADPDLAKKIQGALDYVKKNPHPTAEELKRIEELRQIREIESSLNATSEAHVA